MTDSIGGISRAPTNEEELERLTPHIKAFRQAVDALIQQFPQQYRHESPVQTLFCGNFNPAYKEAYDQARIHLTDAKMWGGKLLEALGSPFPANLADKADTAR